LALHEREQVCATKSSLAPTANTQTRKRSRVRPSAEGSLADVQELRGGADVEQLVAIGQQPIPTVAREYPNRDSRPRVEYQRPIKYNKGQSCWR